MKERTCSCCGKTAELDIEAGNLSLSLCRDCAVEVRAALTVKLAQLYMSDPLQQGAKGWFVNTDMAALERATVDAPTYKDGKLYSFGLDFEPEHEGDVGDYDVFDGSAFNHVFFLSKEEAELELKVALGANSGVGQ